MDITLSAAGKNAYDQLKSLIVSQKYLLSSFADRAKMITDVYQNANSKAKQQFLMNR